MNASNNYLLNKMFPRVLFFYEKIGRYKPTPLKMNLIPEIWTDRKRKLETLPSILLLLPM
jgi:hypothetical protein